MSKFSPSLDNEFLENIPGAFGMDKNQVLSKDEFDNLFNVKAAMSKTAGP
jgi:plasmid replication initiation protein